MGKQNQFSRKNENRPYSTYLYKICKVNRFSSLYSWKIHFYVYILINGLKLLASFQIQIQNDSFLNESSG